MDYINKNLTRKVTLSINLFRLVRYQKFFYFKCMKTAQLFLSVFLFTNLFGQDSIFIDKRDGRTYKTVKIGEQEWMAENLAYSPFGKDYTYYNEDESNQTTYGNLYKYEVAKEVCPSGWHLPTDNEWYSLFEKMGGIENAGKSLKSTSGWNNQFYGKWFFDENGLFVEKKNVADSSFGNGDNTSGFNVLPGGFGNKYNNSYKFMNGRAFFWTYNAESSVPGCWVFMEKFPAVKQSALKEYPAGFNESFRKDYSILKENDIVYKEILKSGYRNSDKLSVRCVKD